MLEGEKAQVNAVPNDMVSSEERGVNGVTENGQK